MPWWSWIVLGAVLLISEIFVATDFYLVFFAVGAIVAGLLAALGIPVSVPWQWILFAAVSIVSLLLFRSRLRRKIRTSEDQVDNLAGLMVEAKDAIAPGESGHATLRGTVWAGRNSGPTGIAAGERCLVESVEGLVLSVRRAS